MAKKLCSFMTFKKHSLKEKNYSKGLPIQSKGDTGDKWVPMLRPRINSKKVSIRRFLPLFPSSLFALIYLLTFLSLYKIQQRKRPVPDL